ncbi:hypothetical protein MYCTH_2070790 [Thermothelomyces thermophilus ATCC 42464]|uniref:Zn(2)-C6 fungal-type domain-containing protein n=1 Tax=Thermothelomyces thermophilus (strain ATCC 42464 / BCRC 31852 / DSM 1799) TaxID=573729 RepID=G2QQD5_THET4|nr:uncharacterized protein MYCTH_2070790 [Thermothelomyces thermophilus ATCC 42464]AEO61798.1 hypothetical protein MYCTH_2070790 [Thermothelomyces thermophilus ATCC 42464]
METTATTETTATPVTNAAGKPYHAKRPHRKSRTGCRNCKARKVKCDEGRPACRMCTLRRETCVYMAAPKRAPRSTSSSSPTPSRDGDAAALEQRCCTSAVVPQPQFRPGGHDETDMRLLWFYTTATYSSFSTGQLKERNVDVILKVNVVQHAFANRFLMDTILGLSAMHINHLGIRNLGISRSLELQYRARAFENFRKAVEAADPSTYPALLITSLFLCGLSTHVFRGEEARPFAVLDWMNLWKGIGTIIELIRSQHEQLFRTRLGSLVFRPAVDLDASARCIPNQLLLMIASIKEGDPDFPLSQVYYRALQLLGSLYLELRNGFTPLLFLRIVTFFTFFPNSLIRPAREMRPRALVIIAHYLVFTRFKANHSWWIEDIAQYEIPNICSFLGPGWEDLLRLPIASLYTEDNTALARLLLGDPSWHPPSKIEQVPAPSLYEERELAIRTVKAEETAEEAREYLENYAADEFC